MNFEIKNKIRAFLADKIAVLIASLVMVFFMGLYLYFKSCPPEVVSFDFKGTYVAFTKEALNSKLSQEKIAALGQIFPLAVGKAVAEYTKKHHVIVLVGGAVMAGARDVTVEVQQIIAQKMQVLAKEEDAPKAKKQHGK